MKLHLIFLFFLLQCSLVHAQDTYIDSVQNLRDSFEQELLHSNEVLNDQEKEKILNLNYFPIDKSWVITAQFKKKKSRPFKMPTTSSRKVKYQRIGILIFEIDGKEQNLEVYKNLTLKGEKYKDYVFIPFKDANVPEETYGGGRYLDLNMTGDEETIAVDFNLAYNPYCVYSYRYSCPLTPEVNHLEVKINAGVKNPTKKE
ncbi:DUF1684 domain-containing protein [Brumimicrobium aurantiacum]|uniref:DUF1684 domain-containing protein n=1 Tax=Brumimicrobium aurantiacum TaxID=1737063 RepID=A0A3E1EW97_9FLAO|nr:DUF1684 domain-containing protein [Brumimicrobium aurantiacum]RFC53830.1 DUF1684 domain-containing protein [Brumimicrobium aurantiacum]